MGSSGGGGGGGGGGLTRYGSAPTALLNAAVDSVVGPTREFSALGLQTRPGPAGFYQPEAPDPAAMSDRRGREEHNTTIGLQPSYGGFGGGGGGGGSSSSLLRQSSSPAGFLNQLATAAGDRNGTYYIV